MRCGVEKRKAEQIFADHEIWKIVPDRDRREIYEDILQQLEKREKVRAVVRMFTWY
jgi:pre-mRNA-processing factor 40